MATTSNRFLARINGATADVAAAVLGGAAAANSIVATNSSGLIDISFFPAGIGQDTVTCPASEAISAGQPVNFYSNSGTLNMRNADSTVANGGKQAHGFVLSAVASGASGTAYRSGQDTSLSGLTVGATYYLAASGSAPTTTPTSTSGQTSQVLGIALSATTIDFQLQPPIGVQ